MNDTKSAQPAVLRHQQQLIELHRLLALGKGESEEADALRDEMDSSWAQLSFEQTQLLDGLSADLFMLQDQEVLVPAAPEQRSATTLGLALEAAWRRRDWVQSLRYLRMGPTFFPKAHIAFLRYRAYDELGLKHAAAAFLDQAVRLDPAKMSYQLLSMVLLLELGRIADAVGRAEKFLGALGTPAPLRIQSANVLFQSTAMLQAAAASAVYERIITVLNDVLSASTLDADEMVAALLTLGLAYESLHRLDEAGHAYDRALQLKPDNDELLIAKASLTQQQGRAHLQSQPTDEHRLRLELSMAGSRQLAAA